MDPAKIDVPRSRVLALNPADNVAVIYNKVVNVAMALAVATSPFRCVARMCGRYG